MCKADLFLQLEALCGERLAQTQSQESRKQNLHGVAGEEGDDAVAHARRQIHPGQHHEPDRAERIADGDAEQHFKAEVFEGESELAGKCADNQRAEDVTQNIAARFAEKNRGTAAEACEHRRADDAQQRIDDHGQRTILPAEQRAAQVDGEEREVNRNHRQGNLNLGADGGQSRHQSSQNEAARHIAARGSG